MRENLAESCCGCFSLTTGVYIIAGLDLLQGLATVFLGLCVLTAPESFRVKPLSPSVFLSSSSLCFSAFLLPFLSFSHPPPPAPPYSFCL